MIELKGTKNDCETMLNRIDDGNAFVHVVSESGENADSYAMTISALLFSENERRVLL